MKLSTSGLGQQGHEGGEKKCLNSELWHAYDETDEVYAQMTLQPLTPEEQNDTFLPMELGIPSKQPTNYFCKTLIASDTSTHGGFSVPRRAAEKIFPPLDSQNGTFLQQAGVYLLVPRGKASPSELVISLSKYIKDLMTSSPF